MSVEAPVLWFETDAAPADVSLVEELTKLNELKDIGLLTAEEFDQLKANLLGLVDDEPAPAPQPEPEPAKPESLFSDTDGVSETGAGAIVTADGILLGKKAKHRSSKSQKRAKRKEQAPKRDRAPQGGVVDIFVEPSVPAPAPEPVKPRINPDDFAILPPARLRSLRTEQTVARAIKRVKEAMATASVDDVGDWLNALGLGHREAAFRDHGVDGQLLSELTEDELRDELGLSMIGERAKIRRARDAILTAQHAAAAAGGKPEDPDAPDAIVSAVKQEEKRKRWMGHERIKVQARLSRFALFTSVPRVSVCCCSILSQTVGCTCLGGDNRSCSEDPWLNLKVSAGDLGQDLDLFRVRLASALQVSESALGHLEYMDSNGDWFACMNEYDVWDGVAEQSGRALVLQVVEARAPGAKIGEAFDHDGRRSLVEMGAQGQGAPGGTPGQLLLDGSFGVGGVAAPSASAGEGRPQSTEQLQLYIKALLRRGAIDDAAAELKSWLGARGHEPSDQPYNTLLKLTLDDKLPSSTASSILRLMEDDGLRPGARTYQYALRIMVACGDVRDAADVLRKMELHGVEPDGAAYDLLVQGLAEEGDTDSAFDLAKKGFDAGHKPSASTLAYLLDACTQRKAKGQGIATFKLIKKSGYGANQDMYAAVISCACAALDVQLAATLLKESLAERHCPGLHTFNAILTLCAEQNTMQEAVRTFKRLQKSPVEPDADSYGLLLQTTASCGDLQLSTKIVKEMVALGFAPTLLTCNQLLGICVEQKAKKQAVSIFKFLQMSASSGLSPDAQSFEHLLQTAIAVNDLEFVVQVLKHMIGSGYAPHAGTTSELLDICAQRHVEEEDDSFLEVGMLFKMLQTIALQVRHCLINCFLFDALSLSLFKQSELLSRRGRIERGLTAGVVPTLPAADRSLVSSRVTRTRTLR
eukprot:SAG11_NODE_388_length_9871_cov_18.104585_2_plen_926_part_00